MTHLTFSDSSGGTLLHFRRQFNITKQDTILYPNLSLQAGSIYDPFCMKLRKDVYEALYSGCSEDVCKSLRKAQKALDKSDEFTIWYSSLWPDDVLSMLLFVHTYKDKRIYLQDLSYAGYNLCCLQDLRDIEYRQPVELSNEEKETISREWNRLVEEHKNFRILSVGKILSVADDHYDDDILSEIGHEDIRIARVGEKFIRKHPDHYVSFMYRIMTLVRNGTLILTPTDSVIYTNYLVRKA